MTEPRLSVVVVSPEGGEGVRRLMDRLAAQTIARDIEVLVAVPPGAPADAAPEWAGRFHAVRFVTAEIATSATARVPAIRAARAPYVALAEDHCFPVRDDWAGLLVAGLEQGHAAVGPVVGNANPGTVTSWAVMASEYSPWFHAPAPREAEHLAGHNTAYERDTLLAYGERLLPLLEAEYVLHRDLRARGRTLLLDPRVRVEHLNYSFPRRALKLAFLSSWMFAASRSREWSPWRRALYAAASPAIGPRRLPTVLRQSWRAPQHRRDILRASPMLAAILFVGGLGEGIGYAFGDLGRRSSLARLEYHRWRNMKPGEVALAR